MDAERRALNAERWRTLSPELRTPRQVAGRGYVACGATHGIIERCDFGCTSCYLTDVANKTPPLSEAAVRAQLDTLRRELGPAAKIQLTSGEVTLLDVDELGGHVAYARSIGLDPMVMSHGDRFLSEPAYLRRLVLRHGLEKVSIHVDSTQRGRRSHPRGASELRLNAVRDQLARLIRDVRRDTGRTLHAAHTVTLTPDNLDALPLLLRWSIDNADAFRMVSFQPVAAVGRTRDRSDDQMSVDAIWQRIRQAAGRSLRQDALQFGHPACNVVHPLLVVRAGGRGEIVESVREGHDWDARFMAQAIELLAGVRVAEGSGRRRMLRYALAALRRPSLLAQAPFYALHRAWGERRLLPALARGGKLGFHPLAIVVHRFMDADELDSPLGRERLANCVFKLPIDGRMVSMCEVNATSLRYELNLAAGAQRS